MTGKNYDHQAVERMMPLLRSIGREIRDRTRALDLLEARIEGARSSTAEGEARTRDLIPEISLHRRELRRALQELVRLGCDLESEQPLRILIPGAQGGWTLEGQLDETDFRVLPIQSKA